MRHPFCRVLTTFAAVLPLGLVACATSTAPNFGPIVRVVTYNIGDVGGAPPAEAELRKVLEAKQPQDVVFLQEASDHSIVANLAVRSDLFDGQAEIHHVPSLRLAILTNLRTGECGSEALRGTARGYGWAWCEAIVESEKVLLVAVHLPAIEKDRDDRGFADTEGAGTFSLLMREWLLSNPRSAAADHLVRFLSHFPHHSLIVGGDFNTVPYMKTIRIMEKQLRDVLRGTDDFLTGSYWKVTAPPLPRVDFIFVSEHLSLLDSGVTQMKAGDHYPVWATLQLPACR
jgi:endonuclease/exonuclease/phosphatase family metal-dependent hydrolase